MAGKSKTGPHIFNAGGVFWVFGFDDESPQFSNKAEAEKWMRRKLAALSEARQPQVRPCLTCGQSFQSDGIHNRMCNRCRAYGANLAM